jgi:hypothetical protein
MNEKDFLVTLIAYLEVEEEFEILELLKDCDLTFNYTSVFASKSYQFRAYVDLRVPIQNMKKLKEHISVLNRLCKDIFIEDEEYALYGVDIKPMMLKAVKKEPFPGTVQVVSTLADAIETQVYAQAEASNSMKVCDKSVECIAISITGDNQRAPYKSGYELVKFFNQLGFDDIYGQGFPSRKQYAIDKVTELNSQGRIKELLSAFLDPRDFIDLEFDIESLVDYINKFLFFDKLVLEDKQYEYELVEYTDSDLSEQTIEGVEEDIIRDTVSEKRKLKLFFSYSHVDEVLRNELEKHLIMLKHKGIIDTWHDRIIDAGTEFDTAIDSNLESADIILLLVSVDFLASNYCYNIEMKKALEMHKNEQAVVIPVILRNCDWHNAPFSKLMAVPTDGKSVTTWSDRDTAFLNVTKSIENVASNLIAKL